MLHQTLFVAALAMTAGATFNFPGAVVNLGAPKALAVRQEASSTTSATTTPSSFSNSSRTAFNSLTTTTSLPTSLPSIQVLLNDQIPSSATFQASIIAANPCGTTIALACQGVCTVLGESIPAFTVTQNPSTRQFALATTTLGVAAEVNESCAVAGTTSAVCVDKISASTGGQSTATTTTTTLTGGDLNFVSVAVTAGADKLATATGSCTTSGGMAAPTGLGLSVVKVVVPVVAVVGGALL